MTDCCCTPMASAKRGTNAGRFLPLLDLAPTLTASQPDVALDGVLALVRRHVRGRSLGDDLAIVLLENTAGRT